MTKRLASGVLCGFAVAVCALCVSPLVQAQDRDKGESKQNLSLKARGTMPRATDVDEAVTLQALLDKKDSNDWSTSKVGVIEGYIVQLEREEDGDYHVVLGANAGETDTTKWVIAEVTPAWARRKASLSAASLKRLRGQKVRVTGWLYYEPDVESSDPRGTRWELHPVTQIVAIK
jgi:hypothetical protein